MLSQFSHISEQTANFAIDPVTGLIRARVTFDREVKSVYNVTVVARDHGIHPRSLSTTVTVRVNVIDENEPPTFPVAYPVLFSL